MPSIGVAEYYAGKSIFITGATGFMGKVLVEKLLRSCQDLKTIYILVRKKKGQSAESRLETFISCRLFENLQKQNPKVFNKLRVIPGDILEEGLGISAEDLEELEQECQIVFNNAACVSFKMPIREAVNLNTVGVLKTLQLAERMKKLVVFLHVSTAFCHDGVEILEEKMYPSKHNPFDVIECLKWMDDELLDSLQETLIKPYPNTYGYTKCLSEQVLTSFVGKFPIAIGRPSIVIPSAKEPMPGWIDNINGPSGVVYAASRGVLHSMYCTESTKTDAVPVDISINGLILLAYFTALERPKDIRVCNITQSGLNAITWKETSAYWQKYLAEYPLSYSLWYPVATGKNYKIQHQIAVFFTQTLPAYFVDLILFILGKKTFMINLSKRLDAGMEVLEYYTVRNWTFKNDYFKSFETKLSKDEREIFTTDLMLINLDEYMKNYIKGMREFYCKEDDSTLPKARKLHKRLYYLHIALKTIVYALCAYVIYRIYIKLF
ncbi:putative fatty acyl-CoA reductase CG5065 [Nymphalis io]|uniref:putative fatty acyl-CoA reductase CG5065 n=1 Tax=Inachis io TaxID=171585 RepID=UPI002167FC9E|nr:putative fatty acyl-CoA reductase CG5065 [Nymphalis io]XP_050358548.1 putative fatty acyl-CoA reductase CG5065 [Nymphalis io]